MNRKTVVSIAVVAVLLGVRPPAGAEEMQEILVNGGDTLRDVAAYYLKDPDSWRELLKHNNIPVRDPGVVLSGMRLSIPVSLIKDSLRAAQLLEMEHSVFFRRKTQAEWGKARPSMKLYNGDTLRTLQKSSAKVRFPSGQQLQLDENSLAVLKHEEAALRAGGIRASKTTVFANDTVVAPVITRRSVSPDFRTRVKDDKTTLVEVYDGTVDVTAQGKTVTVSKGFGTEIKYRQQPSRPVALRDMPDFSGYAPGADKVTAQFIASDDLKDLDLGLETDGDASPRSTSPRSRTGKDARRISISRYHIQIAKDDRFRQLLRDETRPFTSRRDFDPTRTDLPAGEYYYRFAFIDDEGFEGEFSSPIRFTVPEQGGTARGGADSGAAAVSGVSGEETVVHESGTARIGRMVEDIVAKTSTYATIILAGLTMAVLVIAVMMLIKLIR